MTVTKVEENFNAQQSDLASKLPPPLAHRAVQADILVPISLAIPTAESKTGLLKNYTCYCVKVNDFGRKIELEKRFDDFVKLHESLSAIPGVSLPTLPPKQLFGGNDPKIVEERRPALEKYLRDCLLSELVLSADPSDSLCKFLEISDIGCLLVKILANTNTPPIRHANVIKLAESIRSTPDLIRDHYRLFNESVLRVLIELLDPSSTVELLKSSLEILQYILSKSYVHPLASTIDVQQVFVSLGGVHGVWRLLAASEPSLRDACRKCLSSLISSNMHSIEKFESLFNDFLQNGGLPLLVQTCHSEEIHEITAKLVWFGLSDKVMNLLGSHPQGLGLLGKFFASPDAHAKTLAALTLCVLLTENKMSDDAKSQRAMEGVRSILESFLQSSAVAGSSPSASVLSALCRGSTNGVCRIKKCLGSSMPVVSDFCCWFLWKAQLPFDFIEKHALASVGEDLIMKSKNSGNIVGNPYICLFLYRLYEEGRRLPQPRPDNRVSELLLLIQKGVNSHVVETQRIMTGEHNQYVEFQKFSIEKSHDRIRAKHDGIPVLDFTKLVDSVSSYKATFQTLNEKVKNNANLIGKLGSQLKTSSGGTDDRSDSMTTGSTTSCNASVNAELLREWNQSMLGMKMVRERIIQLESALGQQAEVAKSAQHDSNNMQQVVSNMRTELSAVDSRAEEFRKESSRFAAAANAAVDPDEMLKRAKENEDLAKEEIGKREALRQSQDSLEHQLASTRTLLVQSETKVAELRKAIAESTRAANEAAMHHAELERMFRSEFDAVILNWKSKLDNNANCEAVIDSIVGNCAEINKLIEKENEQTDSLAIVIADLIAKLQILQSTIAQ